MSSEYKKKWRRRRARVDALVERGSSSESEGSVEPALAGEGSTLAEGPTYDDLPTMEGCSSSKSTVAVSIRGDTDEEHNYETESTETDSEQLDETSHSTDETIG